MSISSVCLPLNEMQEAVSTVLKADTDLTTLGVKVADYIRNDQNYPVVVIGQYEQVMQGNPYVQRVTMTIEVGSLKTSTREMNSVLAAVVKALTESPLTLAGNYRAKSPGVFESATSGLGLSPSKAVCREGVVRIYWLISYTGT